MSTAGQRKDRVLEPTDWNWDWWKLESETKKLEPGWWEMLWGWVSPPSSELEEGWLQRFYQRYSTAACGELRCTPTQEQSIQWTLRAAKFYGTDGSPDYLTQDEGWRASSQLLSLRRAFLSMHVLFHTQLWKTNILYGLLLCFSYSTILAQLTNTCNLSS